MESVVEGLKKASRKLRGKVKEDKMSPGLRSIRDSSPGLRSSIRDTSPGLREESVASESH